MKDVYLLNNYIKDISKNALLTAEEEIDLSRKILEENDKAALQKLVKCNLRLVVKISMELCKGTVSIMDVIQNGNIGLIKGAEKFDYKRGVRFSTYAAFWIKQSILRGFIKPSKNVNISFRKDELNKKIKNYIKEYFLSNNNFPSLDEIVKTVNVKRKDALDVLLMIKSNGDFNVNGNSNESNDDIIDSIQDNRYNPERIIEEKVLNEEILNVMDSFTNRESEIIKKRFGFEEFEKDTLHNIGMYYNITAEATRQIERKVLSSIKTKFPDLCYFLYAS